jgi:hypothetical protein
MRAQMCLLVIIAMSLDGFGTHAYTHGEHVARDARAPQRCSPHSRGQDAQRWRSARRHGNHSAAGRRSRSTLGLGRSVDGQRSE